MNRHCLPSIAFAVATLFAVSPVATAEPPKIEHVIDLLHQAKDSGSPLPLLEKAKGELKEFNAAPNETKARVSGVRARAIAANALAAGEHKRKAMEAITEAIQVARAGGDVRSKIDHTVAMVHEAGNLKR